MNKVMSVAPVFPGFPGNVILLWSWFEPRLESVQQTDKPAEEAHLAPSFIQLCLEKQ
jgi:hypothetical protein